LGEKEAAESFANATTQSNSTVRALAQCPGIVTAADCARCVENSAQDMLDFLRDRERRHEKDHVQSAGVVAAFRYKCYLQLEISAPILPVGKGAMIREFAYDS
jgi:hypothetical protein